MFYVGVEKKTFLLFYFIKKNPQKKYFQIKQRKKLEPASKTDMAASSKKPIILIHACSNKLEFTFYLHESDDTERGMVGIHTRSTTRSWTHARLNLSDWGWMPDESFHNFRASRSRDRRILCSTRTLCDGFWSSKNVKEFVGLGWIGSRSICPFKHLGACMHGVAAAS